MSKDNRETPRRHPVARLSGLRDPRHHPHLLGEIMRTSQALGSVLADEAGIPMSRLAVLRLLAIAHPDGLGVMRMSRELGVNAAAVTRSVQQLEAQDLVGVRPHPADARRKVVWLTASGLATFQRLHERGLELERAMGSGIADEDLAAAMRVLGRLRAAVEAVRVRRRVGGIDDPFEPPKSTDPAHASRARLGRKRS